MYLLQHYGQMINDSVRTDAYMQALRQTVRPGSVVLDLGTGTGIFALLACQFGARRVYAIEPSDVIEVAREIARANHVDDRITFIQDLSTRVELPEKADVIVSDLRGALPVLQHVLLSIADARRRFLTVGGTLIPLRDTLWAAVVEMPDLYQDGFSEPWETNRYGLDMRVARHKAVKIIVKAPIASEHLLTEPRCWATLDYTRNENPDVHGTASSTVARAGAAHGLAVWFDATLAEDVGFSGAPGQPKVVYEQAFLPLSEPVSVAAGDRVTVTLQADLVGKDYIWMWETTVLDRDQPERAKARFAQSTFVNALHSLARLRQRAVSHMPTLSRDGQVDRFILAQMTGTVPLKSIARRVVKEFPGHFANVREALSQVADLSEKYGTR